MLRGHATPTPPSDALGKRRELAAWAFADVTLEPHAVVMVRVQSRGWVAGEGTCQHQQAYGRFRERVQAERTAGQVLRFRETQLGECVLTGADEERGAGGSVAGPFVRGPLVESWRIREREALEKVSRDQSRGLVRVHPGRLFECDRVDLQSRIVEGDRIAV